MNDPVAPGSGAAEWKMRLGCGHVVQVPWGTQPPFVLACVVEHQKGCSVESLSLDGSFPATLALVGPRVASFR